ncbi:MAG: COX15/CtaA family protein [Thermoplasmata archaeon]
MRGHTLFRYLTVAALVACYVTILLGGNVIASNSGLGCPDWPLCSPSHLIPTLTGAAAIEFSHRIGAFVLSMITLALALTAIAIERRRPVLVRLSFSALVTVGLEAILGGVVVDSRLAAVIVLIHFAIATVLFVLLLLLALLANLREIPRGWRLWVKAATEEAPLPPGAAEARTSGPSAPTPISSATPAGPGLAR